MRALKPLLAAAMLFALAGAAESVPSELRRAAQVSEADHHGVVGFQIVWDTEARGGPFHQTYHYRNVYVFDGERFIAARAIEKVDNGRVADEAGLADESKRIAENERARGVSFADPFDSRHFEEYRFSRTPCDTTCLEGDTTVAFAALADDAKHGDGRLVIDRDGHVRRMTYTPKVMPSFGKVRARNASITVERAAVLPGFWATTRMESKYSGRFGIITGGATQTSRFDHYRRFRTVEAAVAALNSGQI